MRETSPTSQGIRNLNLAFGLLIVVLVGGALRFTPLTASPFPLNDGGLFTSMAMDLAAHGFWLPKETTYNGEAIPFAYPPLALFLASGLAVVFRTDAVEIVRWLPPLLSVATIVAIYLLAAEVLKDRWRGLLAAAAFAVMPRSFLWLVVGGGLTRSLGLLLALLAIRQGLRLVSYARGRDAVLTAGMGGLTLLAHPQAALFLVTSLLVLFGFHAGTQRSFRSFGLLVAAGLGAVAVALPWLIAVLLTHGTDPLLSAGGSALDLVAGASSLLGLAFTDTPILDVVTAIGLVGVFLQASRGQWLMPIWLVVAVVVDPRAGTTFATVPLAMSAVPIIVAVVQRLTPSPQGDVGLDNTPIPRLARRNIAVTVFLALMLFASLRTAARSSVDVESPLHGLQPEHVTALHWVRENLPRDAGVAVMNGGNWENDYISEWFPVLADHRSVATVQGSEWTGLDSFLSRLAMYRQLQACAVRTNNCLTDWADAWDVASPYVFVPKGQLAGPRSPTDCCPSLRETLVESADFDLIYDGPGASIFAPIR